MSFESGDLNAAHVRFASLAGAVGHGAASPALAQSRAHPRHRPGQRDRCNLADKIIFGRGQDLLEWVADAKLELHPGETSQP